MAATLVLKGVEKTFRSRTGTVQALHDINLTLDDGEFVSVVGASGCGKSTLLRIVAGLEPASAGEMTLDGAPLLARGQGPGHGLPAVHALPLAVGTGKRRVRLAPPTEKAAGRRARRFLDVVGLPDFAGSYPFQLSGGMQQRVAIARALALRPSILFMDEPFGALDAQTRSLMQELLLSIWERDRLSVLFVTHDIDEAIFLADRICVLSTKPGGSGRSSMSTCPGPAISLSRWGASS